MTIRYDNAQGGGILLIRLYSTKYPMQLAKMSFDEILDLTADVFLVYNEARERSEPFFPWFSKGKKASS